MSESASMITICNDGQDLINTNYWFSEFAQRGMFFLSWNAGAARLLIPSVMEKTIPEMMTSEYVVISRGVWKGRVGYEIMFEDHSEAPFSIQIMNEFTDRTLPDSAAGNAFKFTLWTQDGKKHTLNGKYRVVKEIPYLQPFYLN
jgi:hypothetical protein